MRNQSLRIVIAALTLAAGVAAGHAQSASISVPLPPKAPPPGSPAPTLSAAEQWIKNAKNPESWFNWGADLRVRNEYYDNIVTLASPAPLHEQDVTRYRGRVWATVSPGEGVSVNARLTAEPRHWTKPAFPGAFRGQQGMEWRYGILDNLNLKWTNAFNTPLMITAGRQDLLFGDYWNWWLVADGTPGDGSWTYFLDSIRLTYDAKDIKTKFDVVYIYQNARPDELVPTLNRHQDDYMLTEQNEQGLIVYASNKSLKNTQIDGYLMYKHDNQEFANGDNANIYTLGARITGSLADHWSYSLEGAYQLGDKQDPMVSTPVALGAVERDLRAYAANGRLSYLFKDKLNNQAHLVWEYLSGDDPNSPGKDEMFDVLWGRWPRWSELYIYSYANETGRKIAQLNNIQRIGAGWTVAPIKDMSLGVYYNAWFAPESVPTRTVNAGLFTRSGHFRGHYLQSILTHTFGRHLKGHLWAEFIWSGDYYSSRDLLTFLRAELHLTF